MDVQWASKREKFHSTRDEFRVPAVAATCTIGIDPRSYSIGLPRDSGEEIVKAILMQ